MVDIHQNKKFSIINIKSSLRNYKVIEFNFNSYFVNKNKKKIFLIDKNVYSKYAFLSNININKILIKATESSKSYIPIAYIINELIKLNIRKDDEIIAIGGGIVQDIAAFISSILFRGIKWSFVPTTILAQSDSCIGGKTSINFLKFKNQLGNFYPPYQIFLDVKIIKTLDLKDIRSGLGEMMHYFLLSNKKDWAFYKNNLDEVLKSKFDNNILKKMIFMTLNIKKYFIETDEFDLGKRLILNYGHTFGHAIEKISNYLIPHGLAVAHGINIANFFSLKLNYIDNSFFKEVEASIKKIIDINEIKSFNLEKFFLTLKKDKKIKNNKVRLVLSKGQARMFLYVISDKNLKELLSDYVEYLKL
jgi:3-dehydroquinate synthase